MSNKLNIYFIIIIIIIIIAISMLFYNTLNKTSVWISNINHRGMGRE